MRINLLTIQTLTSNIDTSQPIFSVYKNGPLKSSLLPFELCLVNSPNAGPDLNVFGNCSWSSLHESIAVRSGEELDGGELRIKLFYSCKVLLPGSGRFAITPWLNIQVMLAEFDRWDKDGMNLRLEFRD
jgi:hypothetical protein